MVPYRTRTLGVAGWQPWCCCWSGRWCECGWGGVTSGGGGEQQARGGNWLPRAEAPPLIGVARNPSTVPTVAASASPGPAGPDRAGPSRGWGVGPPASRPDDRSNSPGGSRREPVGWWPVGLGLARDSHHTRFRLRSREVKTEIDDGQCNAACGGREGAGRRRNLVHLPKPHSRATSVAQRTQPRRGPPRPKNLMDVVALD